MHFRRWDEVAGVDDERLYSHTSDSRSNVQRPNERADSTEEGVHGHCDDPQEEQGDEELRGGALQVGHEINHDVEDEDLDKHQRDVDDGLGDCVGRWPIEGETLMFQKDRATFESGGEFCKSQKRWIESARHSQEFELLGGIAWRTS
jgi:hypothetical protein